MSSSVGKHVVFIYCLYCHDKETSYCCHQYFVSMMIIFVSTRCTMSETFISILFVTIHIYWSWICMVKPPPSKFVNKIFLLYCKNFGDLKFCMVLFLTEIKIIPLFFASNVGIFFKLMATLSWSSLGCVEAVTSTHAHGWIIIARKRGPYFLISSSLKPKACMICHWYSRPPVFAAILLFICEKKIHDDILSWLSYLNASTTKPLITTSFALLDVSNYSLFEEA